MRQHRARCPDGAERPHLTQARDARGFQPSADNGTSSPEGTAQQDAGILGRAPLTAVAPGTGVDDAAEGFSLGVHPLLGPVQAGLGPGSTVSPRQPPGSSSYLEYWASLLEDRLLLLLEQLALPPPQAAHPSAPCRGRPDTARTSHIRVARLPLDPHDRGRLRSGASYVVTCKTTGRSMRPAPNRCARLRRSTQTSGQKPLRQRESPAGIAVPPL